MSLKDEALTERSRRFWNSGDAGAALPYVYPLGGGGMVEASYRSYFEARHLDRIVRFSPGMNVLEMGCGTGRWALELAPKIKHYTGVDFSRQAIEMARQSVRSAGLTNVDLHEQSVVDFRGDRPYDIIYFGAVTQYLEDADFHGALTGLERWLKPDTVIVDRSTISLERQRQINCEGDYRAIYRTSREIEGVYARHGFRKIYQKRSYRVMRSGFINRLERLLPPRLRKLPQLVRLTSPVSFYLLLGFTWLADTLRPVPWHGGTLSHDFFVFVKGDAPYA